MKIFILLSCGLIVFSDFISAESIASVSVRTDVPVQCYEHTVINDPSRNIDANGDTQCDTMFISGPKWIRFTGEGGTQLSTSPTNYNRCGAQVTGWYAGAMPATYQTLNDVNVCFSWENNSCHWTNKMSIINCGSFYIYRLYMPPVCPARYCTETPALPTTTTTEMTTTTTNTPVFLPQCYTHETINDPSRNVNAGNSNKKCDQSLFNSTGVWVRFVGEGGTQIPTSAPVPSRCGTDAGGWYSGVMPNEPYTTTSGEVCYSWNSNTCNFRNNIEVTNCGSFYVYKLIRPTGCSLRYCTDTPVIPTTTTTTEMTTTTSTPALLPQCYTHETINDPTRNVNAGNSNEQCDQNFFNSTGVWVRFVGEGGTQIPTSAPVSNRCGTDAGGWYSGAMPNEPYTTTSGPVCYSWNSNTCSWSNNIEVTNCGSFYVYKLIRPTSCSLRYCTDTPLIPTTTTTTTEMTTTTSTPVFLPQCYTHETINDPSRSSAAGNSNKICDQSLFNSTGTWVRFVGEGGTQIPTSAPVPNRCGTDAAGWYSGTMPNEPYTTTSGPVCYSWNSNTCNWRNNIDVTNCGSFYVYRLIRPPNCNLRYCTVDPASVKAVGKS